jgi:hypothetical protein
VEESEVDGLGDTGEADCSSVVVTVERCGKEVAVLEVDVLPAARKSFTSSGSSASFGLSFSFLNLLFVRAKAPLSRSRLDCLLFSDEMALSALSSSSIVSIAVISPSRDHGRVGR